MSSTNKPSEPKQIKISLVAQQPSSDSNINSAKKLPSEKCEKQDSKEWRESLPIKLEHLLFTFKENSLKVYKASPSRTMQITALIAALLLFCGILALVFVQKDDNLKKNANLPLDQSAVAERIHAKSDLLSSSNILKEVAQIVRNNKFTSVLPSNDEEVKPLSNKSKFESESKDKEVNKKTSFGTFLLSNQDDQENLDENDQLDASDESFDGERSKTNKNNNFNLFAMETANKNENNKQENENDNSKVFFVERLMGLNLGFQPKIGISENLVIRKNLDDNLEGSVEVKSGENTNKDQEINLPFIFSKSLSRNQFTSTKLNEKQSNNELRESPQVPILLKYIAAAMLSRIVAATAAQQQMLYIQQQQQKLRELNKNDKNIVYSNLPPRTRPTSDENGILGFTLPNQFEVPNRFNSIYGLPKQRSLNNNHRNFNSLQKERNIELDNDSQQRPHPIILMLNVPVKESLQPQSSQNFIELGSTSNQPENNFIIPINQPLNHSPANTPAASLIRQNFLFKPRDSQLYSHQSHLPPQPLPPIYTPLQNNPYKSYYRPSNYHSQDYAYTNYHNQPQPLNHHYYQRMPISSRSFTYARPAATIEVPIEVHHQGIPSQGSVITPPQTNQHPNSFQFHHHQHQFSVMSNQPIENHQPTESQYTPAVSSNYINSANENDLSNDGEHMVIFYDTDSTNPNENSLEQGPKQQNFGSIHQRLNKQNNNVNEEQDQEQNNQVAKMLLLHFINSAASFQQQNPTQPPLTTQQPSIHQHPIHQPVIHQPVIQQPEVQQPAIQQPVIQQAILSQPNIQQPTIQQQQAQFNPMSEKPFVSKPVVKRITSSSMPQEANLEEEVSSVEQEKPILIRPHRVEMFDRQENSNKIFNENEQPTSFTHFAQMIRNVVEQQQTQMQQQQQMIPSQKSQPSQQPQQPQQNTQIQFEQPSTFNNSFYNENESIKNAEKTTAQESIQTPAFIVVAEQEDN